MFEYKNILSVKDYNCLRASAGWATIEVTQAQTGLKNTNFLIACYDNEKAIGMTRVIWDGGYAALIVDVIVLPEYQGQGIGSTMIKQALDYLHRDLKPEQMIMITLVAAQGKEGFYKQFGFEERPNARKGAGMTQVIYG